MCHVSSSVCNVSSFTNEQRAVLDDITQRCEQGSALQAAVTTDPREITYRKVVRQLHLASNLANLCIPVHLFTTLQERGVSTRCKHTLEQ